MLKFKPDGFFLSNGPGDPKPLKKVIDTTKEILDRKFVKWKERSYVKTAEILFHTYNSNMT